MNQDQFAGMVRVVVPVGCAWLAAKGFSFFSDSGTIAEISAAVVAVGAVVWSFISHTNVAKLKAAADTDPNVVVQVPVSMMIKDKQVASLVHDDATPNVVRNKSS